MERKELYEEYVKEHPEQMVGLNRLKRYGARIEREQAKRRQEKARLIALCKEVLDGKRTQL